MRNARRHFFHFLCGLGCLLAATGAVAPTGSAGATERDEAASGAAAAPDAATIGRWIGQLDSDVYLVRERATQQLGRAGRAAIEPLARAAQGENLERSTRALRALLELSSSDDNPLALAALQRIARLENRPSERAAAEVRLRVIRQKQALKEIARLGGGQRQDTLVLRPGASVHLGGKWTGGDRGLRHLKDLPDLQQVTIHSAPIGDEGLKILAEVKTLTQVQLYGTNASEEGIARLRKALPNAEIQVRAGAQLGVGGEDHPQGAMITLVMPESSAARAGIRPRDVVTHVNGQKLAGMKSLTAEIARRKAGQKIDVALVRGGRKVSLEIELGRWK